MIADLGVYPHHQSVPCIVHVVRATVCPPEGERGTYAFPIGYIAHQCSFGFEGAYRRSENSIQSNAWSGVCQGSAKRMHSISIVIVSTMRISI